MDGELPFEIRFAGQDDWEEAMGLAWKTFLEFEADVYYGFLPDDGSLCGAKDGRNDYAPE